MSITYMVVETVEICSTGAIHDYQMVVGVVCEELAVEEITLTAL